MSSEIHFTGSLYVFKSTAHAAPFSLQINDLLINMAGNNCMFGTLLVNTSPTAVPVGSIATLGWTGFVNKDSTNYVTLRNGSGGTDTFQMLAGEPCFGPFRSTGAPYLVANTASCIVDFLLVER